jgi:hypothetical protein
MGKTLLAPPQPSSLVETYVVATTFSPTRIFNRPTVINGRNARPRLRSTAECRRDDWVVGGVHWTWRGGRPVGWEGARAGLAATRRLRAAGFRTVPTLPRSLSLVFLTELPSLLLNLITDRTVSIAWRCLIDCGTSKGGASCFYFFSGRFHENYALQCIPIDCLCYRKTGNMLQIVVHLSMVVKLSAPTAVTQNILSIVFFSMTDDLLLLILREKCDNKSGPTSEGPIFPWCGHELLTEKRKTCFIYEKIKL